MTEGTLGGLVTIGELARSTGLEVRTIRFYCDEGVLEARRTSGGHRMFVADTAVEQLMLVRRLRGLGLGLAAIVDVLRGERSVGEVVAAERARADREFEAVAWRRAALRAVEVAEPGERDRRLALLASVADGRTAHDALVQFWRQIFAPMPDTDFDGYVAMNIPEPPADPSAAQVVAYAELSCLVARPEMYSVVKQQFWRNQSGFVRDRKGLLADLAEVSVEVLPLVERGVPPCAGRELDHFVEAHAAARGERDSPGFRERLSAGAADDDRHTHRYWALTGELVGTQATAGTALRWLSGALTHSLGLERIAVK
ncbi:MerR family transcriptional regulator [Nocardia sp. 2]|uniref:MerR family transcriptional regulator n=1 Tax=Nocardia acididurans TaxID=2802282 RepID=A0ABS1MF82_9NOCA|nr:MerR family transcriptional regulator [Nocardia acididurans]MBL1078904.1 MerR family transcriptional regulator [Nocardia acididurans]